MTMTNCTLEKNAAIAGSGGTTSSTLPLGLGLGGGLDMWWFSIASIIDFTFMGNQAMGGFGGAGVPGGRGMVGGISVATNALLGFPDDSLLTISNSTIADNLAQGGAGANGGDGLGGGVVVIAPSSAILENCNITRNRAIGVAPPSPPRGRGFKRIPPPPMATTSSGR